MALERGPARIQQRTARRGPRSRLRRGGGGAKAESRGRASASGARRRERRKWPMTVRCQLALRGCMYCVGGVLQVGTGPGHNTAAAPPGGGGRALAEKIQLTTSRNLEGRS